MNVETPRLYALRQIKQDADRLDHQLFALVRGYALAQQLPAPTTASPREQRDQLVQQHLRAALQQREHLLEQHQLLADLPVQQHALQLTVMVAMLHFGQEPWTEQLPELQRRASRLTRRLRTAFHQAQTHPVRGCSAEAAEAVYDAWERYQQTRQHLSACLLPEIIGAEENPDVSPTSGL